MRTRLRKYPPNEVLLLPFPRERAARQAHPKLVISNVDFISIDPQTIGALVVPVARKCKSSMGLVPAKHAHVVGLKNLFEDLSSQRLGTCWHTDGVQSGRNCFERVAVDFVPAMCIPLRGHSQQAPLGSNRRLCTVHSRPGADGSVVRPALSGGVLRYSTLC